MIDTTTTDRRRWLALAIVCMAQLMIVLDTTIVNVALPSIQHDLHFTQGNLTWVVNAFLVTFGSFLLLAGRLGDLIGRRSVFLAGVFVFTVASALCGIAPSQGILIVARFLQGVGAAAAGIGDPRDHRHRVPAAIRARPRDGRLRLHGRRRRIARPTGRRRPHRGAQLALDLLRQPPDRRGNVCARPAADPAR